MSCAACVSKVRPALEALGLSEDLAFDMKSVDKIVRFTGQESDAKKAIAALNAMGYSASVLSVAPHQISVSNTSTASQTAVAVESFKPLILIALYLIAVVAVVEINGAGLNLMRAMNNFMGGFFLVFSFFKFLDLPKFAEAFAGYDIIAKRSRAYAVAYPFIEVLLGLSFLVHLFPGWTNSITALLMFIGNLGVIGALRRKQSIQCACLGTVFNLPMTKVTLFENTLMLGMSLIALFIS